MNLKYSCAIVVLCALLFCAHSFGQIEQPRARRSTRAAASVAVATTVTASARAYIAHTSATAAVTSSARSARLQPVNELDEVERSMRFFETAADGDLRIGYALSAASGYYDFDGNSLAWRKPAATDTHYLAVAVQDAGTHWLLTGCKVSATLTDSRGKDTSLTLTETWDPHFRHYGTNLNSGTDGTTASLTVKVEPAALRRRDKVLGAFFIAAATAKFASIDLSTSTLSKHEDGEAEPEKPIWPAGRRPYTPTNGR